ncbi:MAG: exodeoxyribonuclease V subunit gamma [Kiritimatiellia bacterium]
MAGRLDVFWSDRLELLAEGLFACWEEGTSDDPFARICIVVGDMSTRDWLKRHFLLRHRPGKRRILANVDFKPLAEFVNDWLAAMTGGDGKRRNPGEHPYSRGVMAWRIDAILRVHADDPDLAVLANYVAGPDGAGCEKRRFELATRLAQMYDDYLGSRHQVLVDWERALPGGRDRWQAALYRLLVAEDGETYARDYATVLDGDADAARAFGNGFCRYDAVHVFDVASAPSPYLRMLQKISQVLPVLFWNFNPSRAYWLDDPARRERKRLFARRLAEALQRGGTLPEPDDEQMFETPEAKLLGALATGARGVLSAQLDMDENGCQWLGDPAAPDFSSLRAVSAEVHACHSPRRELESARDALHRFFAGHPDARLGDALVLCTDWAAYSPLVEPVFGSPGSSGAAIPVSLARGVREETPIVRSFKDLLAFRDNRFEVDAVFALLAVPAIRARFSIDPDGVSTLREMVRASAIRWGYDDADVQAAVGLPGQTAGFAFTWRRGLDRFVLDALYGPRADARELVDAGALGRLLPVGQVESERARLVGALNAFVRQLARLRAFLRDRHGAETWRRRLLETIDDFYAPEKDELPELASLRRAVDSAVNAIVIAKRVSKCGIDGVSGELMCENVLAGVKLESRRLPAEGDAVHFAPLQIGSAVPARFVWICGLSDGAFPRMEYRPSFDLIGRHPTWFDVCGRERDTLSLLKAALGARDVLAFSYVGRDVRSNEKLPAAVPLMDLLDWFRASGKEVPRYDHPLQAYSARYFAAQEDAASPLPPNYSAADRAVAAALREKARAAAAVAADGGLAPFVLAPSGETRIAVDELARFYARPHRFLARERLGVRLSRPEYDRLEAVDELVPVLPGDLACDILLRGSGERDVAREAERLTEEGHPFSAAALAEAIAARAEETAACRQRPLRFTKSENEGFECVDMTVTEAFVRFEEAAVPVDYGVRLDVDGHPVVLNGVRPEIPLNVSPAGQRTHVFFFSPYSDIYPALYVDAWIRHLAGHAAGGAFVTVLFCAKDGPARTFRPVDGARARELLAEIVRQATRPMVCDPVAARNAKKDELPAEFAAVVDGYKAQIVSTRGKRRGDA